MKQIPKSTNPNELWCGECEIASVFTEAQKKKTAAWFLYGRIKMVDSNVFVRGTHMDIRRVGVVGAGTMGNGIAHVFARGGYDVVLCDVEKRFLDRAIPIPWLT